MAMHRINRVEFELEVSAVELGRQLSDRVSMLSGQRIPSLLDRVCSEVDDSEQIDRIDALELELGTIGLSSFDDELLRRIEAALRQALRERTRLRARTPQGGPEQPIAALPVDAGRSLERSDAHHRSDDAHELLDCYAWTGNLPWWADPLVPDLIARNVHDLLVHAPERWLAFLHAHAEDRVGLDRLARACDAELFDVILERAGAGESLPDLHALEQLLALVEARVGLLRASVLGVLGRHGRLEPARVLPAVLRELDADMLAALAERIDAQPGQGSAILRAEIARAITQRGIDAPQGSTRVDAATDARAASEPARDAVELVPRTHPARAGEALSAPASASESPQPTHARVPGPGRPPADEPELQHARRRALARLDELYVQDAGLVLLWPFIERLFTRVDLLDARRRFRDDAAEIQAIALLAYLARADDDPPEHQLALAKLLCGRAPEQPCPLDAPLDPALHDECELLLAAVIDHAPVLDGMPIPRFRASFLQRTGALSVRAGSWLLAVERQPYDLVLERFSWSWAWVKFPWMPEALTVEW